MITFFDAARQLSHGARVRGFPSQFAELAGKMEIPISDPETIEGTVLLKGEPVLVRDIREAAARLHPYNQQLAQAAQAKSIISVPLKIKSEVLGALTVDRIQEWALTQDDLKLIETLATQVAIALDNTKAYGQIEELNVGLEAKVRQRTTELEQAMAILKRFFSPQLADLLVTGGRDDLLRSHRREITVVFLDLRGYSSFAETAEPEEVTGLLQDYQTTMGELIIQYNGTLERFTGDGMMIFFNDPVPMPNASETAVRMAHAMRQTFSKLQNKWIIRGYQLGLGIGIAYGPATMGTIGFEGRWDYAAIGPVTNLASRLCSEAQHGQILVSRQFLQTVENVVVPELIGELTLKGFRRPVSTYNIKALKV